MNRESFEKYINIILNITGTDYTEENLKKGVLNVGNRCILAKVLNKALKGENIKICSFGGSITEGAGSGNPPSEGSGIKDKCERKSYPEQLKMQMDCVFEEYGTKIELFNAGIGATDTPYGIHRIQEDVLAHNPDIVILDWCVNDAMVLYKQATYEAMVRKLLSLGKAVIMFSFATIKQESSQKLHEPISKFYNVPHLSYKNAFMESENWNYIVSDDGVHPNSVGHTLAAGLLTYYIGNVFLDLNNTEKTPTVISEETINKEALYYDGAYIATIDDIYNGKVNGVRIVSLGSFVRDNKMIQYAPFRKYWGYTAIQNENASFEPMQIVVNNCKTAFVLMEKFRNTNSDGKFNVEIHDILVDDPDNTFNSSGGSDSNDNQIEWHYHWASKRICYFPERKSIRLKITPELKKGDSKAYVKLFALLLS